MCLLLTQYHLLFYECHGYCQYWLSATSLIWSKPRCQTWSERYCRFGLLLKMVTISEHPEGCTLTMETDSVWCGYGRVQYVWYLHTVQNWNGWMVDTLEVLSVEWELCLWIQVIHDESCHFICAYIKRDNDPWLKLYMCVSWCVSLYPHHCKPGSQTCLNTVISVSK